MRTHDSHSLRVRRQGSNRAGGGAGRSWGPGGRRPIRALNRGSLLSLQQTAGNRAVAALVQREKTEITGQVTGSSRYTGMAQRVEAWFKEHPAPYTIQLYTTEDGMFGHAWVGLASHDGANGAIGFFPTEMHDEKDYTKNVLTGVPGIVREDQNAGTQNHTLEQTVDAAKAHKILDVIESFQNREYVLTSSNCSTFASTVWTTVTGTALADPMAGNSVWWLPFAVSMAIEARRSLDHKIKMSLQEAESTVERRRPAAARYY